MVLDTVHPYWLERAVSNVQRDRTPSNPPAAERRDRLLREMQTSRRRSHGAAVAREHRLIPRTIGVSVRALDVRRQRHVPERIDRRVEIGGAFGLKPHQPSPKKRRSTTSPRIRTPGART
jgi:hypothetical protein